ncbi:MAG: glutamate-1-semialdehyde 2,1-aminomutase [Proteobacteria bacterium]|nr:glutamate-1-semialdehyde 2,1-aminomutase [Pseudomonadota bacterium]
MERSIALMKRSIEVTPGGVNSPVRAFKHVGGDPLFIQKAEGAYIFDADGNKYVDYVGSWGPMILGHNHPLLIAAITKALERGTSFGAPTDLEVEFAELLTSSIKGLEQIRFVNSGTEATMSAIRLARAFTKKDYIIKFNGCYHGHSDSLLVKAGSGVATCGIAGSPGIPDAVSANTLSIEFNDLELLKQTIERISAEKIAAIIIEPIPGNMGLVLPEKGYLEGVRDICNKQGIVLIFDEVMSGFRVAFGGAQERFGVTADLVTYGKIIGGGLPVGAFGGRRDIMQLLAPAGAVYQAGTLSGNPLAMSAGLAVINYLKNNNVYPQLEEHSQYWRDGLRKVALELGVSLQVNNCGSMLGLFFSESPVNSFAAALNCNIELFKKFFHKMLEKGVYLAPSAFEAGFLSLAHKREVIDYTLDAMSEVLTTIKI